MRLLARAMLIALMTVMGLIVGVVFTVGLITIILWIADHR